MSEIPLGFGQIPPVRRKRQEAIPQNFLIDMRSNWQPLSASLFPNGTEGGYILKQLDPGYESGQRTHFLEGRKRSSAVFDRPLSELWPSGIPSLVKDELANMSIREFLLHSRNESFEALLSTAPAIERTVSTYVRNLALSPAVCLAYEAIGMYENTVFDPCPVTPEMEEYVEQAVDAALVEISHSVFFRGRRGSHVDRDTNMFALRFGLKTGTPETLDSIADFYGITRERPRQIIEIILRYMGHPVISRGFRQLLGL